MSLITWTGPRFIGPTGQRFRSLVTRRERGQSWIVDLDQSSGSTRTLPRGWALPGFVDSHAHLDRLGMRPEGLWFAADESEADIAARIRAEAARRPVGDWIVGRGWMAPRGIDPDRGPRLPRSGVLSQAAPDHPVCLKRADEHAIWANAKALAIAGIGHQTPDPDGGRIVRDASGAPTGVLVDAAMKPLKACIPGLSLEARSRIVREEVAKFASVGVTCVHDMAVRAPLAEALGSLRDAEALSLRVRGYLWAGDEDNHRRMSSPVDPATPTMLRFCGIKVFFDGALGSRGARLSLPYPDGRQGLQLDSDETIALAIGQAARGGWQLSAHAIGDVAVRDAVKRLGKGAPGGDHRWRVEHVQIAPPDVLKQMHQARLCAAVQPIHAVHDLPWAERLLAGLLPHAYRWRSIQRVGIRLGLGTDHPIESIDPLANLLAVTLRQDEDSRLLPGADERLSRGDALRAYTRGSAYLAFDERWLGVLWPGYLADFAVWDTDLTSCSPTQLSAARCLAVVCNGSLVWQAD